MAHNLYRFYLYTVFIALLIFTAVAMVRLLSTRLAFTPLQGSSGSVPSQAEIIQSTVFVLVSLLIAGALGGLHYWLIRRDIRNDPSASHRFNYLSLLDDKPRSLPPCHCPAHTKDEARSTRGHE